MEIKLTDEEKLKLSNSDELYRILLKILEREEGLGIDQEHFWVIGLGLDHCMNFVELVALGTHNRAITEPREVFYMALHKKSKYVILAHNHPGGTLLPSEADEDFTDRMIHVAELVYLKVIDHLIIARNGYYSFKLMGLLEKLEQSTKYAVSFIEEEKFLEKGKKIGEKKGREEGLKEGEKIGEERGEKKKAIEMAKALKQKGISLKIIAETSGLSIEEIQKL